MVYTKEEQRLRDNLTEAISDWLTETGSEHDALVGIYKNLTAVVSDYGFRRKPFRYFPLTKFLTMDEGRRRKAIIDLSYLSRFVKEYIADPGKVPY